jgi:hypothetical protein
MILKFTRGSDMFDRRDITTAAGAQPPIMCLKQRVIPHDMVHFAVEAEVATTGFPGNIAAGGDSGFTAAAADAPARSIERLVEIVQAKAWSGAAVDDAKLTERHGVTFAAGGDVPLALGAPALAGSRARLADLSAQWAAVPVRGTLVLHL